MKSDTAPDIIDAISLVAHTFRQMGMRPPAVITLASHDEGVKFLCEIHQRNQLIMPLDRERGGHIVEGPDGTPFQEMVLFDIRIRWPAVPLALSSGKVTWI